MDFYSTIPVPFRVCPAFCYKIPFFSSLKKVFIKAIAVFCSLLFSVSFVLFIVKEYNVRHVILIILIIFLPSLIALVIFLESFLKAETLKAFDFQIICIDAIMQHDLNIDIKLDAEKKEMRWRFIWWNFISILTIFCFFVTYLKTIASSETQFIVYAFACISLTIVMFGPLIIVIQIHFYRVITFIDMVRRRYCLINQCIANFHSFEGIDFIKRDDEIKEFLNSDHSFEKLQNIRRVCRLLYTSIESINESFGWSLLLCVFQSFLYFAVFVYIILRSRYFEQARNILLCADIPYLNNMMSLATVCEFAKQEVSILMLLLFIAHFYFHLFCGIF